jgi:hypothetical protein
MLLCTKLIQNIFRLFSHTMFVRYIDVNSLNILVVSEIKIHYHGNNTN